MGLRGRRCRPSCTDRDDVGRERSPRGFRLGPVVSERDDHDGRRKIEVQWEPGTEFRRTRDECVGFSYTPEGSRLKKPSGSPGVSFSFPAPSIRRRPGPHSTGDRSIPPTTSDEPHGTRVRGPDVDRPETRNGVGGLDRQYPFRVGATRYPPGRTGTGMESVRDVGVNSVFFGDPR